MAAVGGTWPGTAQPGVFKIFAKKPLGKLSYYGINMIIIIIISIIIFIIIIIIRIIIIIITRIITITITWR